jgi:hypothetical protein
MRNMTLMSGTSRRLLQAAAPSQTKDVVLAFLHPFQFWSAWRSYRGFWRLHVVPSVNLFGDTKALRPQRSARR